MTQNLETYELMLVGALNIVFGAAVMGHRVSVPSRFVNVWVKLFGLYFLVRGARNLADNIAFPLPIELIVRVGHPLIAVFTLATFFWVIRIYKRDLLREADERIATEKRLRQEAETAKAAAMLSLNQRDEFLAIVSHELRTPIASMKGWCQLLLSARDPDLLAAGLTGIIQSVDAEARLVEELFDVARINGGKLMIAPRPAEIGPVIDSVVDAVRSTADAKRIDLTVDVEPRIGDLSIDPDRVHQILWNLASNAIKFTPHGGAVAIRASTDRDVVTVVVSDNGKGINAEDLPHVFARYFTTSVHRSEYHSSGSAGLGLGLSIAKSLAELHGGWISAASAGAGAGSRFTLVLPKMPNYVPRSFAPSSTVSCPS